ncbi:hypothetical protein, partial [Rhodovulum sp.]|uniref:hypothetical protein n=1 Tax=Rhodovulum sp. TaxID=34009 RepID=UPI00257EE1F8
PMTGFWARGLTAGLAAVGLVFMGAQQAPAQDAAGGLVADLRFSQRLTWEDDDFYATTGIGLALTSRTRNPSFGLFLDGGLELGAEGESGVTLADPVLRLTFGHEAASSAIDLSLRYRESDVDTLFEEDVFGQDVLVFDEGTRKDLSTSLGFVFGRDAPFGGSLDLGYSTRRYSGTSDPSLLDEDRTSAALALRFDIDPRIRASLRASVAETDRDGAGRDIRNESLGAGLDLSVTQTLTAGLFLGRTRVVESGAGPRSVEDGLAYRLSLTEQRPNGTLSGSLVSDIDEVGRRTTARIDRDLELRAGRLRAGVGVSEGSDGDLRPLISLGWAQDLPRGSFGITLDQAFTTDSDGEEALNSQIALSWRQELTPLSSLQTGIRLRDTDFLGGAGVDTRKITLDLVYRHALAGDWDMLGGYTHTLSRQEGASDSRSDEVFIGVEKRVRWRF